MSFSDDHRHGSLPVVKRPSRGLSMLVAGVIAGQSLPAISASPERVPAAVTVRTYYPGSAGDATSDELELAATRSGFVFEQGGYVVTAYRALTDPGSGRLLHDIRIQPAGSNEDYAADIIGVEPTINLAIVRIKDGPALEPALIGSRTALDVGQVIYGLADDRAEKGPQDATELQYTMGRLVGLNTRECYQESLSTTMLRAEILLDERSIGSPIFNADGEVLAIYTGYEPAVKEGFVDDGDETHILPAFLVENIYDSLKIKQSMASPWTGFSVAPLPAEQQQQFPTAQGDKAGLAIEAVWPDSPAARLGITERDVLVRLGHYKTETVADFQKWLYLYGVGHAIKIVLLREGEYRVLDYTIEERPDWARPR